MIYESMIAALRTRVPVFNGRVGGAAGVEHVTDPQVNLSLPCAYVVPLGETAGENDSLNGLFQICRQTFAVVVCLEPADRRGQGGAMSVADVRSALLAALLNWRVDPDRMARGLEYDGYDLVEQNRARLVYEFRFVAEQQITDADGWRDQFPDYQGINVTFDCIDPFDPNAAPGTTDPRQSGPDGRAEGGGVWDVAP